MALLEEHRMKLQAEGQFDEGHGQLPSESWVHCQC